MSVHRDVSPGEKAGTTILWVISAIPLALVGVFISLLHTVLKCGVVGDCVLHSHLASPKSGGQKLTTDFNFFEEKRGNNPVFLWIFLKSNY